MKFAITFFLLSAVALSLLQISSAQQKAMQATSSAFEHSSGTHELAAGPRESTNAVATVKPEEPVITMAGLCSARTGAHDAGCNKIMTREEFEDLLNAINPGGQPVS